MEGLGDFGLLVDEVDQDNVYQNLLASIDRRNLSGSSITVGAVHALSKKVFIAKTSKNKPRNKAPTTMLSKKEFAHILVYICNRNVKLDEVGDTLIRNIWNPPTLEKQFNSYPHALWPGLKFLGAPYVETPWLYGEDEGEGSGANNPTGTSVISSLI